MRLVNIIIYASCPSVFLFHVCTFGDFKTNLSAQVVLYEDELDDNGCAKLSVKMRAMPSGILLMYQNTPEVKKL